MILSTAMSATEDVELNPENEGWHLKTGILAFAYLQH